jgi:hypothetical protein
VRKPKDTPKVETEEALRKSGAARWRLNPRNTPPDSLAPRLEAAVLLLSSPGTSDEASETAAALRLEGGRALRSLPRVLSNTPKPSGSGDSDCEALGETLAEGLPD